MRWKHVDLFLAFLIVLLNSAWVQLPVRPWFIGLLLVLPLVLFLPGYTLTQALFRKRLVSEKAAEERARSREAESASKPAPLRLGHPIGRADQFILSLGLSMALDILVGFTLNLLSIKLEALSWTLALGLLVALFALLALYLRRKDGATNAPTMQTPRLRLTWLDAAFFLLAICIVFNAVWLAVNRPSVPQSSFTQFWMVPGQPTNDSCVVSVGVQNFETATLTYSMHMTVNNVPVNQHWSNIVLAPEQKWEQALSITPEAQSDLYIAAQLYRTDRPQTAYREVHLTLHVATLFQNGQAQLRCTL